MHVNAKLAAEVVVIVIEALPGHERPAELRMQDSLLELGFDSLSMTELAVALEEGLGIREFPLQLWADAEASRDDARFTLGSLVTACAEQLALETGASAPARIHSTG